MLCQILQPLEKKFFRTLNNYLEPLLEAGVGSPGLAPVGAVVLETKGRKSGRTYKVPLLASEVANLLLISTVRGRSQWIKNLAAKPQTRVWLRGRLQSVTAYVIGPELASLETLPEPSPLTRRLIEGLEPLSRLTGASFAILAVEGNLA